MNVGASLSMSTVSAGVNMLFHVYITYIRTISLLQYGARAITHCVTLPGRMTQHAAVKLS